MVSDEETAADRAWMDLRAALPSVRMRGATQLLKEELSTRERPAVLAAHSREPVPQVRAVLLQVLMRMDAGQPRQPDSASGEGSSSSPQVGEAVELLQDIGHLIRHELSPAVGWIELAADDEVDNYDFSETQKAVAALWRRVVGLADLASAHRQPTYERASLLELLTRATPPDARSLFNFDPALARDDTIQTDTSLFELFVGNALKNAADAVKTLATDQAGTVSVVMGLEPHDFWVTITNPFSGVAFAFEDVAASGFSSKATQRGLGTRIMVLAARRLDYEFHLQGVGGIATFSLRGRRWV